MILMLTRRKTPTETHTTKMLTYLHIYPSDLPLHCTLARTEGQRFRIDAGFAQIDENGECLSVQARVKKVGDLVHGCFNVMGGNGGRGEGSERFEDQDENACSGLQRLRE